MSMNTCATETTETLQPMATDLDFEPITITAAAANYIKNHLNKNKDQDMVAFRLEIKRGGCSGKSYNMLSVTAAEMAKLDRSVDQVFTEHGATVVINKDYADDLSGIEIDYVEDGFMGGSLKINNPNAKHGCGCGKSFS